MATDIGHALRKARHSRGVTLSDAARHTGVRETHLAALERDELETYGIDPVYVRGIVRAYAEFLGLDAAALLARYTAALPIGRGTPAVVQPGAVGSQRRGRRWRTVAAVAGGLVLAMIFAGATVAVLSWQGGERQRGANPGEPVTSEPAIAAGATGTASDGPSDGDRVLDIAQSTEEPGELRMKLEFTDTVWVRVLVDGRNELEGVMGPGAVTEFTGTDEIELRLGVADAVEFSLNGAWYGTIASSHDGPVSVTCTAEGGCEVTGAG